MDIPGRRINVDEDVITAPFPRGGDGLFLRIEQIDLSGTDTTTVKVFTRNREDVWPTTGEIGTLSITATAKVFELHLATTAGIKEELRLKISRAGSTGWSLIRILPPLFYDAAIGTA